MAAPLLCSCCLLLVGVNRGHLVFESCLGCREPCRQQTEGRAGDVVEADLVAELDGLWIAAVLAADADLEVGAGVASLGTWPSSPVVPTPA